MTEEDIVSAEPYFDTFQFGFFSNYTLHFSRDIRALLRDYFELNTAYLIGGEGTFGAWRTAILTGERTDTVLVMMIEYRHAIFHR